MSAQYRPFMLARQGELAAAARLTPAVHQAIVPIFLVPPRPWDFDTESYSKSVADHLKPVPVKLSNARGTRDAFVDITLLDSDPLIGGKHPLEVLVDEADSLGLTLTPMTDTSSSSAQYKAIRDLHTRYQRGAGVRLAQEVWTTVDSAALAAVQRDTALQPTDIDVFVDFADAAGPVITAAVASEVAALQAAGYRSVTIGGAAFPNVAGVSRGVSEFDRTDWLTFEDVHARLSGAGDNEAPNYFDHLVLDPQSIDLGIDPRFMSISATFRYAIADKWLFAKGQLFKGQGGSGIGGAALPPALTVLRGHPKFGSPVGSQADVWIDEVIAGTATPGNPSKWREWATVRHIEVTESQVSSLI